ncbi:MULTISPECIES: 50S ribosomal protein L4 [Stappiaceae]|jgi:large subunit ribosomal protein L4|uniref:Large ribosomal subunit protein uL4 n=2 Tax=Roseibium TaxID=150830 RepID=A0A0M6XXX0_9HYPH|nr:MULTISPECIES: 50S ribosomal protein L4 [Stappiaceae]MCR9282719.1 50S ribosomal protein L4 [Paracoccaceae bacterium]MEC9401391.1 50S ribosomal protein L4 [Pseudomonadota bacterium]AMN53155.1 50S ribosomal protein L4 [Labrenzia sp. CP4]AQQ06368.1 50S ribosomal protein L4 [Roseibium aggregatum]MBN8182593.1 50S ribosomal protein L4 [Roseibium aggregatum]
MELQVKTLEGGAAGSITVSDEIFGLEPRTDLIHRVVRWQLAKRQAGTHKALGRSEVSGTTKKFVRQKGSGGARHGNKKAPQFRGGGKAFGPIVRDHSHDLPKKVRALGLKHALSAKAKTDSIVIVEDAKAAEAKTKALKAQLTKLGLTSALIIDGAEVDANFALASRNIPHLDVLPVQGINVYDILRANTLVLTKAAVSALEERFK